MPKLTRETQDSAELHKSVDEKKRVARRQLNLTKPQTAGWGRLRRLSTKAGMNTKGLRETGYQPQTGTHAEP